ncbi:helix-turn-helix domain-containing protein [Streptomyces sp. NPDC001792]|uniref:winged helix-turn-helix transcriptional regulator n=1 Tax=Streptomyces sp. NPDC001792 TaxID=3154524 RepID=UPI00332D517C
MAKAKITDDPCPFGPVMDILFARWTSHILWALTEHGRLRFSELRALLPGVTPKVLTERLRKLERDGLVTRTYHAEVPPRVEYEATELAATLEPVLLQLTDWAARHLPEVRSAQRRYDDAGEPSRQ